MKLYASKLALFFLGLLITLGLCCAEKDQEADKSAAVETKQEEAEPNAVAKIGDYTITKEELEKELMMELLPDYGGYGKEAGPVDAKTVLLKMIAEKAAVIDAREQNYPEDETIQAPLKRFKERELVKLLLANRLADKITVTDSEIDEKIKANPKLNRARAKQIVERAKANRLINQYYSELYEKFHVQKLSANFLKAAQIHRRLLLYPKEPRRMRFVRVSQAQNELTPEEKTLVLAAYDKGQVTLKNWFEALFEMSPPSRPKDLNTPKGVERLLERALMKSIFVSEAELLGFDKNEDLLKEIKKREDMSLLNKAMSEKTKDIKGPITEEQIVAYYNKNKEVFGTEKTVKIDQIWCQDLKTAQKAKAELDSGKDFESVRQEYSFGEKGEPYDTYPGSEGIFFKDLWKGKPNEIVGPVKGFYGDEVKWRIVKILEKKPGEVKEYSSDMNNSIEMKILDERRDEAREKYRKELLKKYSYEIYDERIRDIDPLNIP